MKIAETEEKNELTLTEKILQDIQLTLKKQNQILEQLTKEAKSK